MTGCQRDARRLQLKLSDGIWLRLVDVGEALRRRSYEGDDSVVLEVTDDGPGIDPAEHERIFERFVQVDGSATRRVGGAGLGLAITRALAELMGGEVRVESAVGQGAAFTVALPLRTPAGTLAAAA